MGRRGVRALLLVVVSAAFVGIGWQTWRSMQRSRLRDVAGLVKDLVPNVTQHIRDFRRVKVKNGRVVWEVEAREAQYYEKEERVVVTAPRVVVYFDDGERRAELSGEQGHLDLADRELDAVRLEGSVRLLLDDLELTTDQATYERSREIIVAPGPVVVRGRSLDVEAVGMEVELQPQHLRFLADVHTELKLDDAAS
jgi:LPS export ABC transporter protein LptC